MVDHVGTLGPIGASVEVSRKGVFADDINFWGSFDSPVGVDNSAHHAAQLVKGGPIETILDRSLPARVRVTVNDLGMLGRLKRLLKN